jgi:ketosteroid isomerase-like protein
MPDDSTTPDLVELTRRAMESAGAWTADPGRSPGGLAAPLSFFGPDSVWDMSHLGMGEFNGLEAIGGFLEEWSGAFEDFQLELEEIDDLGGGVILAVAHQHARLQGSTGHVDARWASITEWADGRIARVTHHTDIDEARTAAERRAQERAQADV